MSAVQQIRSRLNVEVSPGLAAISVRDWERLFTGLRDSLEMVALKQSTGFDGFQFHTILVKQDDQPILMVPLFQTHFNLTRLADGWVEKLTAPLVSGLPHLFNPQILGVGFVEGEWGQIGIDSNIDKSTLTVAWDLAFEALNYLAEGVQADLIAFYNFNDESGKLIPPDKMKEFLDVTGFSCCQIPITYDSLEQYFESLSKGMKKNLKRKMKKAQDVEILHTCSPEPWIDKIYDLYCKTVERQDLTFATLRKSYFERVCHAVPGAEYVLYFVEGKLSAFNLVVLREGCLVDQYFGMNPEIGRQYALYFVSWAENIRYCIDHKIELYHAGSSAEDLKKRLNAEVIPSLIFFKHRNPLAHYLLKKLKFAVNAQVKNCLPPVELGSGWSILSDSADETSDVQLQVENPSAIVTPLFSSK